jgi:hypothetical protein
VKFSKIVGLWSTVVAQWKARKLTHIDCRVLSCAVAPHNSAEFALNRRAPPL